MKKPAFTLAEALITLVILGVVAALIVPSLKRFSQTETAAKQLKKAYTVMNQDLDYILADDISLDIEKIGGNAFFTNYMLSRLNAVKQCTTDNMTDCFAQSVEGLTVTPVNAVLIADGTVIANSGMDYIIDVNGTQEPNIEGVDVFLYTLKNVKGVDEVDNPNSGFLSAGWKFVPQGKAKEIMANNWKIKKY